MHFVGNEKKRHSKKTGNETSCEKRETRNEKRDISYEKWDILRNVWHLTRNLVVSIEKMRQFQ